MNFYDLLKFGLFSVISGISLKSFLFTASCLRKGDVMGGADLWVHPVSLTGFNPLSVNLTERLGGLGGPLGRLEEGD